MNPSHSLFAAHISDGVLRPWPQLVGLATALFLVGVALRRLKDGDVPRIVLCTAVFFTASLIHVKAGPTSVHLLLNGLMGMLLGFQAVIPIALGLFMQAVLFGHGGFLVWGVNCCIFFLPALMAPHLFLVLQPRRTTPDPIALPFAMALGYLLCPIATLPIWLAGQWLWLKIDRQTPFVAGFGVGFLGVVMTVTLEAGTLMMAGNADWKWIAGFVFLCHLPVALIEGMIVGFAVEAIATSRPELLDGACRSSM